MSVEFTRAWALLGLAVVVPLLLLVFARSLSSFPRGQRRVSLAVRVAMATLILLALGGLTWLQETGQKCVVFVIDRSLSVGEAGRGAVDDRLPEELQRQADHRVGFLEFGAVPGQVRTDVPAGGSTEQESVAPGFGAGTDIAAAIESAAGFMPPGYVPQIVLLSDGNQTEGDAAAAALQTEFPVDVLVLPARSEPEVQVSEVIVPAEVRQGEPFFVEVMIHSSHDDEGLIEVFRGNHRVASERREIRAGENRFQFQQSVERERLADFTVRISGLAADTLLDNNSDSGLVYAAGRPRVLIIESQPEQIREFAWGLENEGIQADIRPPEGIPQSLTDLQNFELLILSDVPATAFTRKQMEIIQTFVRDLGGGFIMLGGEQSFGLGGYFKSTLEELLPVRSDFEKEKEKPSLAMVLCIDKSGSMKGEKLQMARSAARSAVELLGENDQVAVLAFDGQTSVVSDMQRASAAGEIDTAIARIDSGGGTSMFPSMELANEMLQSVSARLKHVILLTDGVSSPGDFAGMAQAMASGRITISTVAVGQDADTQLLQEIARIGRGRYYFTSDATQVPQIFAKETVTAGRSAIDELPFLPQVIRTTHVLRDVDLEAAPFLMGYVMTRPKPASEVILATENGDPLLVWWRYGLGMTAAFTSDVKSRWAAEWIAWDGFSKFWTQVSRHLMRQDESRGIAVRTERRGSTVRLELDAVDDTGRFLNDARVELSLIDPQLKIRQLQVPQTAPGLYQTEFEADSSGAWHLEMAVKQDGRVLSRQSRGLAVGYSDELRIRPADEALLRDIARHSGGRYNPPPAASFEDDGRRATRPTPLWPYLLTVTAILLVFDVALRRIDFTLHWPLAGR